MSIEALALKVTGSLDLRTFSATGARGVIAVSADALDVVTLVGEHARLAAGLCLFGSVLPSIAALYAGFWFTRWVVT